MPLPASLQMAPAGLLRSLGQPLVLPSQISGWSQAPAAGRQMVPLGFFLSAIGQVLLAPSHVSSASHGPTADRQTTTVGCLISAGQAVFTPSQVSVASQRSTAARQTVVFLRAPQLPLPLPLCLLAALQAAQIELQA